MSISGEINRIRSEVNTQTDLISQIRSALNGKVAGGGAVIEPILQDKTITENGTYTADSGYDGLGTVTVSVESSGVDLPKLSNEGAASDLMLGKELINGDGDIVVGTYVPLSTDDATATSEDIVDGKTAYVKGQKVTGTNPYDKSTTDEKVDTQTSLIEQIKTALEGKSAGGNGGGSGSGTTTPKLQVKSVTPTKSAQSVTPDSGYDGLSEVNVSAIPSDYIIPSGTKSITENGTHDVKNYASVSVNVQTASSGGNGIELAGSIVDRTVTEYIDNVGEAFAIGQYAFYRCSNLTLVVASDAIGIGGSAFCYCSALVSVDINGGTSIGAFAFSDCSSLTTLTIRNTSKVSPLGNVNVFNGCGALTRIYVPASLVSSYKSATNWSAFADKIYAIEE